MNRLQVGERLKIVYERITLTRFTKAFIIVAVVHCLVQIALQSSAFFFNKSAGDKVWDLIDESQIPHQFAFVSSGKVFVCSDLPPSGDPFETVCWPIAGSGVAIGDTMQMNSDVEDTQSQSQVTDDVNDKDEKQDTPEREQKDNQQARSVQAPRTPGIGSRGLTVVPTFDDGSVTGVNVTGLNSDDPQQVTQLSSRCINALNWPSIALHDAKREDISFLCYQVWLLGISLVTILNESIPHLVAALVTHGMSTAWSAFQLSRTGKTAREYQTLIVNDACDGVDVITGFWGNRMYYLIPILVLNVVVLLFSFGLSLKLFRVYARQTFNRVGASKKMNVLYSYVLLFSVFLQLSAFFTICGSALWLDALSTGVLKGSTAYRIVFTIVCVVEIPWVIMGWISIRREHHICSLIFLITGLALCAAWSSMFASVMYRWSFRNFPFFATLTISAFIVLVGTVALALVCRIDFGKGLPQYLKTEVQFDDSSFIPVIVPKKRRSKAISVVFPDKRTSALKRARNSNEKPPWYNANPYERPPSETSIIDIKAPGRDGSGIHSDVSSASADDGHGRRSSLLSRVRAPFFRLSDNSRFGSGKMSLRFSAFTSNSTSADLERDVPDVPQIPVAIPKMPAPSFKPQTRRSMPEPKEASKRESGLMRSLSVSSRAADLPAINIIPASVSRSAMLAEQGGLSVRAASEYGDSIRRESGRIGSFPSLGRSTSSLSTRRGSPPGPGFTGLPINPRAYRH
ncbi:hypothetical protein A7U60_g7722 [Sanghuangporus baumii]|uniref:Uncharacterized protein n=1 Tax=Sanghuangporus baumii TaxID=108892 RepID=A0A9Q5MZH2_SANBA|nr:hypothetical protein A7U60_g7722 [Sanghuangporus baumii]